MVNVLGVPVKIVSDISGVSIPMITRHYLKANETQLRLALRNASWHFSGSQEDQQIPASLKSLSANTSSHIN